MINQQYERELQPVRHPLDPITIVDDYALMVIAVGAMLDEVPAQQYLIGLIDRQAKSLHSELSEVMIRPSWEMTQEEYDALNARQM